MSGVQQSDSYVYIHTHTHTHIYDIFNERKDSSTYARKGITQ